MTVSAYQSIWISHLLSVLINIAGGIVNTMPIPQALTYVVAGFSIIANYAVPGSYMLFSASITVCRMQKALKQSSSSQNKVFVRATVLTAPATRSLT